MIIGRTIHGSPAVYIGRGQGLFVSAMTNERCVAPWRETDPTAERFPLPTQQEANGAAAAIKAVDLPCDLLLEVANLVQPEDKPHASLTPLHRVHMKITACLARFRE